jgi:hypothetical protein
MSSKVGPRHRHKKGPLARVPSPGAGLKKPRAGCLDQTGGWKHNLRSDGGLWLEAAVRDPHWVADPTGPRSLANAHGLTSSPQSSQSASMPSSSIAWSASETWCRKAGAVSTCNGTDLIPNLVDTVAYAAHERTLLENIVRARASSIAATTRRARPWPNARCRVRSAG